MTTTVEAYRYSLYPVSGDNYALEVQWLAEDGSPVDLSTMVVDLSWIVKTPDYEYVATDGSGLTIDLDDGSIFLVIDSDTTANFLPRSFGSHILKVYGSYQETIMRGAVYVR